jgi:predicted ATPase/class 3 adenylate cyclase
VPVAVVDWCDLLGEGRDGVLPTGTVTFLFTDIEASTPRWETDAESMGAELAAHDEVLRSAIAGHGGFVFKHTGDGVCAAFGSATDAVEAAVEAQRLLRLPVRVGIATGTAELRGGDYFGPPLNRVARVMAAAHGGQILVAASTAALLEGVDLADLGEHHMQGLSGFQRVFQVRAEGLRARFPPLRTLAAVPGNLPVEFTRFVGRNREIAELTAIVARNRLVTLTGVGGVGKTRLALQVARRLVSEFADGVWLVELAPLGDPAALPDVVATALGIRAQPGLTVLDGVVEAVAGRRMLVVLDNCEHVQDAAADLVAAVLARTSTVSVLATSREGLALSAEHLWPVPSLDVDGAGGGSAVELFVERARAVRPGFSLGDETDWTAVVEICRRLDGIPLAIELAAARMVSINPTEVLERLSDRFRRLAGARRGPGRHQTLRHAVAWSFELLSVEERDVLGRCAVFAGGFDVAAAAHVCDINEYEVLDVVDSLVRKSLMTATQVGGHTRYGMYETIRLFAEEQIDRMSLTAVRDRHARYFAEQVEGWLTMWDSPDQRIAVDRVDVEFANLRAGFYWAAERGDIVAATKIAAHTALCAQSLQRYEPVGWAEELLDAATAADVPQLPRLYTAAAFCSNTGRPDAGLQYARRGAELDRDPKYDPLNPPWAEGLPMLSHTQAGRVEMALATARKLATRTGMNRVAGLAMQTFTLPALGRNEEARTLADQAVPAAREHGNPFWIVAALTGYGRAYADIDPEKALGAFREARECAHRNHNAYFEPGLGWDFARLEAVHGDLDDGLIMFDDIIDAAHRGGTHALLGVALANLALVFRHLGRAEIASTICGCSTRYPSIANVPSLSDLIERLRDRLGQATFEECVATGSLMETADAVRYAREQIQTARDEVKTT